MINAEQLLGLAMEDPMAASEAISQLVDPVVGLSKELITKYASEFGDQVKQLNMFLVQLDIDAMDKYTKAGFARDEALQLITVRKQTSAKALNFNQK